MFYAAWMCRCGQWRSASSIRMARCASSAPSPRRSPDLVRCLRAFGEPIHQVDLEAGTLTQHLTYGLTEAGFDVVCMEARHVNAALSAMRNKTDRHDARGIAQILRSGWHSRVHVKSVESHHLRALITARKAMQRKRIDLENEIRGLLKIFGVKLPLRLSRGGGASRNQTTPNLSPAAVHRAGSRTSNVQAFSHTPVKLVRRRGRLTGGPVQHPHN